MTAILFVGDIVASAGRRTLRRCCPGLREELALDFVVVNGENAAGGIGITPKHADELFAAGVDVITLGNHTYRHREVCPYLDAAARHPAAGQLPAHASRAAARASSSATAPSLGVVNLRATSSCRRRRPAFATIDDALREVAGADHVLVDMHAEATSEKVAMGWYLDGRVTAVVGTHTHVPTADARVLPGGTAYITDVGMTGARGGVIGVKREQSIAVFRTHMPMRYEASDERPVADGGRHPHRRGARPSRARVDRVDPAARPSSADEHQRQEPDDVEVEPVLQRELERDQHRGAERGHGDRVAAARDEGDDDGERERGGERRRAAAAGRSYRPQTENGDAAVGLEAERAVVERAEPVAERDRRESERGDGGERRPRTRSRARARLAAP